MAIHVFDYRKDIANVVVHPEIRGRFMRMEPGPAGRMHSHDLGGEIFLVLEGQCEFLVEEDRVTCGPGQLIYVEPRVKHTLHAVGDAPCVVYLSVTPHIEPTHTHYDEQDQVMPPRYGTWRGTASDVTEPDISVAKHAQRVAGAARHLAEQARTLADVADHTATAMASAAAANDQTALKQSVDQLWYCLRDVLRHTSTMEADWNQLAPRAMPTP